MKIIKAEYVVSNVDVKKCPAPDKPEYAFIGRSNVGKSSLINMLAGRMKLAKVSGSPGKTITINHFLVDDKWYLVDLPGYGFAKRSKTEREKWEKMIKNYILNRENLMTLFLLVDLRLEPQAIDLEFIGRLGDSQIPFVILFTKADKLGTTQIRKNLAAFKKALLIEWEELPRMITTSAKDSSGKDELLEYIDKTNQLFVEQISSDK